LWLRSAGGKCRDKGAGSDDTDKTDHGETSLVFIEPGGENERRPHKSIVLVRICGGVAILQAMIT
jgi:hypothetical protein